MKSAPVTPSLHRSLVAGAALACVSLHGSAAHADTMLEQPPREVEFRLDRAKPFGGVDLLMPLRDVASDRLGPVRLYTTGRWGQWVNDARWSLAWGSEPAQAVAPASANIVRGPDAIDTSRLALSLVYARSRVRRFDFGALPSFDTTGSSLSTNGFDGVFRLPPVEPVVDWRCRRKPVLVMRSVGGESDRFPLVRCDNSIAPEAMDRLSILARPPEAERPGDVLPDEPQEAAWNERREWTDGVRVVHPRLVWALQQLADAFPNKAIILYSGYRPFAEVNDGTGHKSLHAAGRALDISIHKVHAEDLFRACTKLRGIGCGLYPNNKFVHLDIRRAGAGEAFFIDLSLPGEPAKYATDYPGLVQNGRLVGQKPSGAH